MNQIVLLTFSAVGALILDIALLSASPRTRPDPRACHPSVNLEHDPGSGGSRVCV